MLKDSKTGGLYVEKTHSVDRGCSIHGERHPRDQRDHGSRNWHGGARSDANAAPATAEKPSADTDTLADARAYARTG
jgi:hypothetical protein